MVQFSDIIISDPEILGGEPVFRGTRVPVRALLDSLSAGDPLASFLEDYPSVSREQATASLELARASDWSPVQILLDESLPRRLAREFSDHDVETVFDRGWSGLKNGTLLRQAEVDFDVFVTADQNLQYQQNLIGFDISVVVLRAVTNRIAELAPLFPKAEAAMKDIVRGEVRVVE